MLQARQATQRIQNTRTWHVYADVSGTIPRDGAMCVGSLWIEAASENLELENLRKIVRCNEPMHFTKLAAKMKSATQGKEALAVGWCSTSLFDHMFTGRFHLHAARATEWDGFCQTQLRQKLLRMNLLSGSVLRNESSQKINIKVFIDGDDRTQDKQILETLEGEIREKTRQKPWQPMLQQYQVQAVKAQPLSTDLPQRLHQDFIALIDHVAGAANYLIRQKSNNSTKSHIASALHTAAWLEQTAPPTQRRINFDIWLGGAAFQKYVPITHIAPTHN